MRIFGKVLGWILALMLMALSACAFAGAYFSPVVLGIDFLMMAAIVVIDTLTQFKKPCSRYRKFIIEYDDGTEETHTGPADGKWWFSIAPGKRVICIDVLDFDSAEGDNGKQD